MNQYRDFGPVPWWAWTGKMEKTEMLRQLKLFKSAGIDEFFIFALYGLEKPEFLSEEWFDYVAYTIDCCKELAMKVWIYDDLNWPSGSAGGKLLRNHPEHRSKSLFMTQLEPNASFKLDQFPDPLAVFAGNRESGFFRCDCNALENGQFMECERLVFEVKYANTPLLNCRGLPHSRHERGYFDMLSKESVRCWMSYIHLEYQKRFSDEFGKTFRGFFFDEPYSMIPDSYGEKINRVPWTWNLADIFRQRFNYDLTDRLPEIFLETPNPPQQVRNDYWQLVSELGGEGLAEVGKWCDQHNLLSTGHCVYEEPKFQRMKLMITPTMYDLLKHHSAPGMDLLGICTSYFSDPLSLWYGTEKGVERNFIITAKQLTSTARYTNAQRTMAEAMGVRSWGGMPCEQKLIMDWLAGMGVNLLNDNSFVYSIADFRKRGIAGKHFTQPYFALYKYFSDYCRRVSQFAKFGQLHTAMAVLLPDTTIRTGTAAALSEPIKEKFDCCEVLLQTVDALMRQHCDFELLFSPLLTDAIVENGLLKVPNSAFSTIIIPRPTALTAIELEKLAAFVHSGGNVVWMGNYPEISPDLPDGIGNYTSWIESCSYWTEEMLNATDFEVKFGKFAADLSHKKYLLEGDNVRDLMSALRYDGENFCLFIANQSQKVVNFKLKWYAKPLQSLCDPVDNAAYRITPEDWERITLQPMQSLIFSTDASENLMPISEMEVWGDASTPLLTLPDKFDYELTAPNIAQICFHLGLPSASGEVIYDVPVSRFGRHNLEFSPLQYEYYYLSGDFEFSSEVPPDFGIICENSSVEEIWLNDIKLADPRQYELWDAENIFYPAVLAAKKGMNHLRVKVRTSCWNSSEAVQIFPADCIEPIVLCGSFAVEFDQRRTILGTLPVQLQIGDIAEQGLPQYIGKIRYLTKFHWDLPSTAASLRCEAAATLRCELNNQLAGEKMWGTFAFNCKELLIQGENTLTLEITTTLGNLLRYAYRGALKPAAQCGILSSIWIEARQ